MDPNNTMPQALPLAEAHPNNTMPQALPLAEAHPNNTMPQALPFINPIQAQRSVGTSQPTTSTTQRSAGTTHPTTSTTQRSAGTTHPNTSTTQRSAGTTHPTTATTQRSIETSQHRTAIIELSNIYKSYGELNVLKGIDLEIYKSEIISLTGPSGAGKSTLMHIIGTLDKPNSGSVKYHNIDVMSFNDKKLSEFRNQNIGFIFQFHHLLQEFTALENICIPAYIAGKGKKETEAKAMELLEMLSLKDRAEHKPSELSGGEQQRVAVARSLINNPEIILADEPSGNLDSENALELHNLFFELRKNLGITCVIVTHNEELAKMADRQIRMIDGKLKTENS